MPGAGSATDFEGGLVVKLAKFPMAAAIAAILAVPAQAAPSCPAGLVCASNPQTVVSALQKLGYKALLGTSENSGNPKIDSSAAGYDYTIYFYDCRPEKGCGSLGFTVVFEDDGTNTAKLANAWNRDNRFSQMAVNDNGTLAFTYDVTTVGGLNQANFADVVDWWQVMLGKVRGFFGEQSKQK